MAEFVAEQAVRVAGHRVYLPKSSQQITGTWRDDEGRKRRRRGEIVVRPAFRGYLFAELWPGQQWRHLVDSRLVRGVQGLLCANAGSEFERPKLLRPEFIEEMRQAENDGEFDIPKYLRWRGNSRRRPDLDVGSSVRVETGPFAGFLAEVAELDDRGRSRLLVEIFGRATEVWMDRPSTQALEVVAS